LEASWDSCATNFQIDLRYFKTSVDGSGTSPNSIVIGYRIGIIGGISNFIDIVLCISFTEVVFECLIDKICGDLRIGSGKIKACYSI
jgi:hypothetical protein